MNPSNASTICLVPISLCPYYSGKCYTLFISISQECLAWYRGLSKRSVNVYGIGLRYKHLYYAFISRAQWAFSIPWVQGWGRLDFLYFLYGGWVIGRIEGCSADPNAALLHSWNLFPAARSLGDPGQPRWELISICYKLENQHFPFSWPEAQAFPSNLNCICKYDVLLLDVWGQSDTSVVFPHLSDLKEKTHFTALVGSLAPLKKYCQHHTAKPKFFYYPAQINFTLVFAQGHHVSPDSFSHWPQASLPLNRTIMGPVYNSAIKNEELSRIP